jgi:hypothetical protein
MMMMSLHTPLCPLLRPPSTRMLLLLLLMRLLRGA